LFCERFEGFGFDWRIGPEESAELAYLRGLLFPLHSGEPNTIRSSPEPFLLPSSGVIKEEDMLLTKFVSFGGSDLWPAINDCWTRMLSGLGITGLLIARLDRVEADSGFSGSNSRPGSSISSLRRLRGGLNSGSDSAPL
jgi:hypothetical protein